MPDSSSILTIEGEGYRHLALSLRKKVGERLRLRLPSEDLFEAEIIEITKKQIRCRLLHIIEENVEKKPLFILLQWELKGEKMDVVIRQATEIGATHIMPIIGEYSASRAKNEREKERREKIVDGAREQSGSPIATKVFASYSLSKCLDEVDALLKDKKGARLVAYEKKEASSKSVFSALNGDEDAVVVCIGAEGGISEAEYSLLTEKGFCPLHFSTNILKAETASIYALSALKEAYVYKSFLRF